MHSLDTVSSDRIKEITKLHLKKYRDLKGLYICEGAKILDELKTNDVEIKEIFVSSDYNTEEFKCPVYKVNENIMKKLCTTDSPCEILAVVKKKEREINEFKKLNKLILLDKISDPGNLGTIIRSAAAFNIDGIILFGNCVDLYSSKVIRSCAGNFFKTPVICIKDLNELKKAFEDYIFVSTSLSEKNNISLEECAKLGKYIVMLGSEAIGLSKDLLNISNKNIKLPMGKNVESLNLSVSASIILYELYTKS